MTMNYPYIPKVAVVDAFLGRPISLHDTEAEAELAIPRGSLPGAFRIEHGVCTFDPTGRPSRAVQPSFF